jgi:hypothetical protein
MQAATCESARSIKRQPTRSKVSQGLLVRELQAVMETISAGSVVADTFVGPCVVGPCVSI